MNRRNLWYRIVLLVVLLAPLVAVAPRGTAAAETLSPMYILPRAGEANDLEAVRQMLARGDVPDDQDDTGRTALSYAAGIGNLAMANDLLQHRARTDLRDNAGNAPLHWAAQNGRTDLIRLLVQAG